MSLAKQLLLLVTLIFFIVFSVNFALSIDNIRGYLQGESEIHAQDTATSLGLSLSPHMENPQDPILRTMMNAIFDTGYFSEMRLVDVDDTELVRLTHPVRVEGVPQWLIQILPIFPATAQSEISSGWNISGTLYVTTNPGYGYLKLYEQFQATLLYSLGFFIAAILLLILVLRFTLKPLREIQHQANNISAGHFSLIEKMPVTTEVREVALSMNSMSRKIGGMVSRLNQKLDTLSDSLKRDPLTGLLNQETARADIKTAMAAGNQGQVIYLKFDNLTGLVKSEGKSAIDQLLIDFAALLSTHVQAPDKVYRLVGSEFEVISTDHDPQAIVALADRLQQAISALGEQYGHADLVHMGIVQFERSSEFERLMPAAIEAYEQAKLIGPNAYYLKQDSLSSRSEKDWKAAILRAINLKMADITFRCDAYNYQGDVPVKVMTEAFANVTDEQGEPLSIGTFFSMAEEFDLLEELDRMLVDKVLSQMEHDNQSCVVTINLSMQSVASSDFRQWFATRLQHFPLSNGLLAMSVSAYAAAKNPQAFASFGQFVKKLGANTLLKRYHSDLIAVENIKRLNVDYIRLARDLTTDVLHHRSKPDFLDIINEVSGLLEIKVLAEGVANEEDFEFVKNAGLFGISR